MNFELNEYRNELTDDEIISDIISTAKSLNVDYLSISQYRKYGKYSQTAIQGHFSTWTNALNLAGLRTRRTSSELKQIQDEDYFRDLQKISTALSKDTVTFDEYKLYGNFSAEHIFKRYKKWDDLLIASGLNPTGLARHKVTEIELFDEIERIWTALGRQPTSTDIIKTNISKYSIDTYKRRFGGWRKALEAFVIYINSNSDDESDNYISTETESAENSIKCNLDLDDANENNNEVITIKTRKTTRNINLRIRLSIPAPFEPPVRTLRATIPV